ncbi:ATP-dependent Clp protease ATP-binding subunit ClpX [Dactylosporangium sp. NPDC051484]|uniref:ATP-dependent Clp protease ATP-binding subunit ClpX n=1 Tax=Dactylosporangium sp. NPDC051484 TaxID=3154942 RepID=UPI00344BDF73
MVAADSSRVTSRCSFCTKPESEVERLVEGPGVQICAGCVELCAEVVAENRASEAARVAEGVPKPREIRAFLDEYIVGQDQAKRALSVAVYNHYKRIQLLSGGGHDGVELAKSNILLLGPTGSGKTLLAQTLARILNVPFAVADATALTQAGYVGEDVDTILLQLVRAAQFDIERAQTGIVYIDEIDKCARRSDGATGSRDVSGEGVQQSLLKILEGTVATISLKEHGANARSGRGYQDRDTVRIDTSHILFILGGAFVGVERIVQARVGRREMGFGGNIAAWIDADKSDLLADITPEDLVSFGMIPEFIGRLPVITSVRNLDRDALLQILTQPKNALVKQYRQLLQVDGVDLQFEPGALEAVADQAIMRGTGARSLRAILESVLVAPMYEVPSLPDVAAIIVTQDAILDHASPLLLLRNGSEVPLDSALSLQSPPAGG